MEYTFTYFGPDALGVRPGLCGAPVVHEKSDDECNGAVPGFVWLNEGRDCIVAASDELVEAGGRDYHRVIMPFDYFAVQLSRLLIA